MHDVLLSIMGVRKMERKQVEVEYWVVEGGQETNFFSTLFLLSKVVLNSELISSSLSLSICKVKELNYQQFSELHGALQCLR